MSTQHVSNNCKSPSQQSIRQPETNSQQDSSKDRSRSDPVSCDSTPAGGEEVSDQSNVISRTNKSTKVIGTQTDSTSTDVRYKSSHPSARPTLSRDRPAENDSSWAQVLGRHRENRVPGNYHNQAKSYQAPRHSSRMNNSSGARQVIGAAPRTSIETVAEAQHNRQCTGLFVSRLKPNTTAAKLAIFVHREWGLTVRPEKLPAKYDQYCSFYIPCGHQKRQVLLNQFMWPRGSVVKPFFS